MLPLLKLLDKSIVIVRIVFIFAIFAELIIQQLLLWICLIYSSIKVWMLSATVSCLDIAVCLYFGIIFLIIAGS